jgi:Na+-translocating ferredoxin:NAD+ oxidoreductase subunit B
MPTIKATEINALLPQTQCRRCGFQGCAPYADAIATSAAPINQCPPGGAQVIAALATLLHLPTRPLNPQNGIEAPVRVAFVIEDLCIGCTQCIQVCPVDAIVGAAKRMHTVIAAECTGCELCIPACPVDCIELIPDGRARLSVADSDLARKRFDARNQRLQRRAMAQAAKIEAKRQALRITKPADRVDA